MMISDGSGIHADSIAISSTIPPYPSVEIVPTMKTVSHSMILPIIRLWSAATCRRFPLSSKMHGVKAVTGHRTPNCLLPPDLRSLAPSMLANQRYKLARAVFLSLLAAFSFDHANQTLTGACLANRNHQTSTYLQLRYQRLWNRRAARGHKD